MTDPAEVRASLLRGDSRDGCARRLAVLRDAPDRCEAFGGIRTTPAEDFAEGMKAAEADDAGRTCPTCGYDCSTADHAEVAAQRVARTFCAHDGCPGMEWHKGKPDGCGHPSITSGCRGMTTLARLANVERLLAEGIEMTRPEVCLVAALADVRALLGGQ